MSPNFASPPSNDERSDEALVAACNEGDEKAFEALYHRYRDWSVGLAYRFTHNREDALDVMQEAFIYLLGKFPGFELNAQMKTVLYPVLRSRSIDRLRKKKRSAVTSAAFTDASEVAMPEAQTDPVEKTSDPRTELAHLMRTLPEAQREALLLRFVDGLSIQEIALATDSPEGTIKSRLHHGIKAMRDDPVVQKFFLK